MSIKKILMIIISFGLYASLSANTTRDIGDQPSLDRERLERWLIFYTNVERIDRSMAPLRPDMALGKAARWQADYCAEIGNLSHFANRPGMGDPGDRIRHFDRLWSAYGENITVNFSMNMENIPYRYGSDEKGRYYDFGDHSVCWRDERSMARSMVAGWMESPGHRGNILSANFSAMGAGAAGGSYSGYPAHYGCQVFADGNALEPSMIESPNKDCPGSLVITDNRPLRVVSLDANGSISDISARKNGNSLIVDITGVKERVYVCLVDETGIVPLPLKRLN